MLLYRLRQGLAARGVAEPLSTATRDDRVLLGAAEPLDEWPVPDSPDWLEWVNAADAAGELEALSRCVRRGRSRGEEEWAMRTAEPLRLSASPARTPGNRLLTPLGEVHIAGPSLSATIAKKATGLRTRRRG